MAEGGTGGEVVRGDENADLIVALLLSILVMNLNVHALLQNEMEKLLILRRGKSDLCVRY